METNKHNVGILYAIGAYACWGLFPIFWKQLDHIPILEIVMQRMVWSYLLIIGLIVVMGQFRPFISYLKQPQLLARLFIASLLMSLNWAVFIWAVNDGQVVESSLGYFINPLFSVLLGVVFFSERLRAVQSLAVFIAFIGVASLVINHGKLPMVSLALAITFSLYGVIKKTVSVPATHGMAIETLFMFVPAVGYVFYLSNTGQSHWGQSTNTDVLFILSGLFTLIPLVLFALAAKKISLTALGMTQYLAPFSQLAIGVFIYHEPFGSERMLAFSLVWCALFIYSVDQIIHQRKKSRHARAASAL